MRVHLLRLTTLLLAVLIRGVPLAAQHPAVDPRDSTVIVMNGNRIVIEYGKPSMRNRPIMGDYVPYNRIWRTGSGKATVLTTDADLHLGDMDIPRGSYSLYTLPTPDRWQLIINKQTGHWGTIYHPDLDYGRTGVVPRKLDRPVQDLTIRLEKTDPRRGVLKVEWERVSLAVPFEVLEDAFLASPRDSASLDLEGARLAVNYGRPYRRGRTVIGGVVPYNEVWRTGANEVTTFTADADLVVGGADVPRGAYSLFSLPSRRQWLLIINKQTGQPGTEYDRALDLARVPLRKQTLRTPVEQFSIQLERTGEGIAVLRLLWEYTRLEVEVRLKK